jgi:hypothetical protein
LRLRVVVVVVVRIKALEQLAVRVVVHLARLVSRVKVMAAQVGAEPSQRAALPVDPMLLQVPFSKAVVARETY